MTNSFTLYRDIDDIVHYVYWTDKVNSGRLMWCTPNDDARDAYRHFIRSEIRYPTCLNCVTKKASEPWEP